MVVIRELREEDIGDAIRCIHSASEANKRDYPEEFIDMLNRRQYTEDYLQRKLNAGKYFLVAVIEDQVVGTISHYNEEIINVFVSLDYQRQGIGRQLMTKMEQHLRDLGFDKIKLNAHRTSKQFYEDLGYELQETIREKIDGHEIEGYKMLKSLS